MCKNMVTPVPVADTQNPRHGAGPTKPTTMTREEAEAGAPATIRPAGPQARKEPDEDAQLAGGLAAAVSKLAAMATEPGRLTCFHSKCVPPMSVVAYMARLHQYFGCSSTCYVLALVYVDRLVKRCPDIVISPLCCHRLLFASVVVAAKFHDDLFYSNAHYSKVGGVRVAELNGMELRLMNLLGWQLQVSPEEYETYSKLCKVAARGVPPLPARCVL